jgi:tetratricopeptide (TPR) repeat protein
MDSIRPPWVRATLGLALALAPLLGGVSALGAVGGDLSRIEAAAERFPADPDLSWLLIRQLAQADRLEEAVDRLEGHLDRWPDRPEGAWLALGQWRYALGRDDEAVAALWKALERSPTSGAAHLSLGLAERRRGDLEAGQRHLDMAAALESELADQALLLAGVTRIERGDEAGGAAVLKDVTKLHPGSEAARGAQLILQGSPAPQRRPWGVEAFTGYEFDSNVTLDSGDDFAGGRSDQDDSRIVWGTIGSYRFPIGERAGVELGVRYDGARQFELGEYDSQRLLGFVSGSVQAWRRVGLRFDGWVGHTWLAGDPYLLDGFMQPAVLVNLGGRAGVTKLFVEGQRLDYDEDPFLSSLERTSWAWGGGLEHFLPVPRWRGAVVSVGTDFTRRDTAAQTDLLGFEGAYDLDCWRTALRLRGPLPWQVDAAFDVLFDAERYHNPNVIDALTDDGVGTLSPRARRDDVWRVSLSLIRPVTRFADLQLRAYYTDRASNVDLYAYDRWITGVYVRVHDVAPAAGAGR